MRRILPRNVACIHHPSGDAKKISTFAGVTKTSSWTEGALQFHWEVPSWDNGATEPGSSGSPLFNDRGLTVGHLHGGQSSCDFRTGYDMYGALWADWSGAPQGSPSYNSIQSALNPIGSSAQALAGMYLRDVSNRAIPIIEAIKPLYKTPRPRMANISFSKSANGTSDEAQVDEEKTDAALAKHGDQLEKSAAVFDEINDLLDTDNLEKAVPYKATGPLCINTCNSKQSNNLHRAAQIVLPYEK